MARKILMTPRQFAEIMEEIVDRSEYLSPEDFEIVVQKIMDEEVITPEEFDQTMLKIIDKLSNDPYRSHLAADYVMCQVLKALGYSKGVALFLSFEKWYF